MPEVPSEIFKAYDIRGVVGRSLTPEIVEFIGRAIGAEAVSLGSMKSSSAGTGGFQVRKSPLL
jgi:phosphomannomutase/phosphoglucomutase